jgi:hypothetical protein
VGLTDSRAELEREGGEPYIIWVAENGQVGRDPGDFPLRWQDDAVEVEVVPLFRLAAR